MPQMLYEWLLAFHILMAVIWGTHIYLPASLVLLLAGVGMVLEGQWGFTTPWVLIGLLVVVDMAVKPGT